MPIVTIGRVNLKRRPRKLYAKDGSAALIGRFDGRHTSRAGLDFPWTGPPSHPPLSSSSAPRVFFPKQTSFLSFFEKTSYNNFHRSLSKPNLPRRGLSINDIINVKGRIVERIAQAKVFISEEMGGGKAAFHDLVWKSGRREREYKYKSVMEYREKWRGEKRLAAT